MASEEGSSPPAFRFRCQRSGNCCARPEGVVRVTPNDVQRIADYLHLEEVALRSRFIAVTGDRLVDGPGGRCPFLADGRQTACEIYPVRPQKCRTWPFWEELRDPAALRRAARSCPGIQLGLHPDSDPADH
jgi:hypothetical protein